MDVAGSGHWAIVLLTSGLWDRIYFGTERPSANYFCPVYQPMTHIILYKTYKGRCLMIENLGKLHYLKIKMLRENQNLRKIF